MECEAVIGNWVEKENHLFVFLRIACMFDYVPWNNMISNEN